MIKAKRIYEPKKDDNFDIQKVLGEAIQKSINSSTDQTKTLVSEFERMSSDAGVKKLEEKFYQYIKNLRIEKEEIKQDVYKSIEDRVKNIGQRIENHDHKEYLTQEDKDECINSATDMVNEAVTRFDNLFNPFIEQLKIKANKDHSHEEFEELKKEIEENEQELENKIEQKADKKHKHEIEDVSGLSETLNNFAKTDHKHDEYATREELDFINRRRSGGGGAHVIQENGVVANQRGNINFIGATVTDDPSNNATVVTVTGGGGGASSYEVTQTAHGFVDTNWLYFDETDDTYKKAQSDSVDTLGSWHVVEVVDANTFKIAKEGVHEIPNTLDLGEYVLSQDTAGGYTQTLPGDLGDYVLYGMEVLSGTHISFYIVPAIPVLDTGGGSGTVTSVAISGSDGLEVDSGSPITTTGTIALGVNKTAMLIHLNVEDGADLTDATNVASAGAFMKATDDTDDITEGATNLFMDSTEQGKLANITVTQAVDLDQMEIDIAALANGMVYKGNRDASAGTFPGGGIAQTGRFYTVSVGGTVNSVVFGVDDRLVATADNASTTIYAGNWTKLDATDAVTSVNGAVGNVLVQSLPAVVSSSRTAVNDEVYTVVANATFTDPSPVEGKGYTVIVRNGTATIGGSGYSVAGSEILRIFHSGAWATYLKTPSSGVNTGDQTTIAGITGTKAEFNAACTDGDFQFGATLGVWYALTGTFVTSSTFTFSGDAGDAEAIERSLFTCLSTGGSTRRIGYVKSASHSAGTVTVTVVTDSDLASGDNTFKVAINRKIEDYEKLITVPGEQVADASNPQGMFYRSLVDAYLLPVNSFVRTAAAGAGAACAWNVYKGATNLFTSAQDMTTSATFDEKRPNTNTITAGDIITLRVTSSVGATNKASDLQVQTFIVPQTLYTIAD